MSKDTKDIKDTFHSELEKATLKELQEAITWRLGDIQKSTETVETATIPFVIKMFYKVWPMT